MWMQSLFMYTTIPVKHKIHICRTVRLYISKTVSKQQKQTHLRSAKHISDTCVETAINQQALSQVTRMYPVKDESVNKMTVFKQASQPNL